MIVRINKLIQLGAALVFAVSSLLAVSWLPFCIVFAALAAFLPDMLRVFGLLKDSDELQEAAASHAARITLAVLVLYAAVLFALSNTKPLDPARQRDAWLIVFILGVSIRFMVNAIIYWDVRAASPRIFLVFGGFWLLFSILSNLGSWISMLIQAAVSAGSLLVFILMVLPLLSVGTGLFIRHEEDEDEEKV